MKRVTDKLVLEVTAFEQEKPMTKRRQIEKQRRLAALF
ncbi:MULTISPECIES: histidine kinase [Vibrio]|nr:MULTISPECIES: histidine kinase [Vibrio]AUW38407.1 histidine kinase [Vibrio mimicus]KAA3491266.1 histidine kinase [Vibrio mimicus]MBJ6943763.1 histidine kinase [Vibrio cholerae]MCD6703848.1 histidine kinase [Vibrio cholerae]HDZ9177165.1 histidine kinase [Vibrio cholerae]